MSLANVERGGGLIEFLNDGIDHFGPRRSSKLAQLGEGIFHIPARDPFAFQSDQDRGFVERRRCANHYAAPRMVQGGGKRFVMSLAGQIDHRKVKLVTKPGQLPFGILPGGEDDGVAAGRTRSSRPSAGPRISRKPMARDAVGPRAGLGIVGTFPPPNAGLRRSTPRQTWHRHWPRYGRRALRAPDAVGGRGKPGLSFECPGTPRFGHELPVSRWISSARKDAAWILKIDDGLRGGIRGIETAPQFVGGKGQKLGTQRRVGRSVIQAVGEGLQVEPRAATRE